MTVRVASWRDVPMPPGVAARPTSVSGLPVPFVAGWEGEETTELREDPVLRRVMGCRLPAVFSSPALEDARPTLGVMEPARQRHVVAVRLCQVCGGETLRLVDEQGPSSFTATISHAEMLAWPRSVCDLRREVVRGLVERERTRAADMVGAS